MQLQRNSQWISISFHRQHRKNVNEVAKVADRVHASSIIMNVSFLSFYYSLGAILLVAYSISQQQTKKLYYQAIPFLKEISQLLGDMLPSYISSFCCEARSQCFLEYTHVLKKGLSCTFSQLQHHPLRVPKIFGPLPWDISQHLERSKNSLHSKISCAKIPVGKQDFTLARIIVQIIRKKKIETNAIGTMLNYWGGLAQWFACEET